MAPRASWRGYLKLSLVTCPVAMLPATSEAEKVRFHTLNRATGGCSMLEVNGKPVSVYGIRQLAAHLETALERQGCSRRHHV
jgi:anaerobic glycerol-3-phosphate dehydrogenase